MASKIPKGWKKVRTMFKGVIIFESKKDELLGTFTRIKIFESGNQIRGQVIFVDGTKVDTQESRGFVSKASALRWAKAYMKRYPDG